MSTYKIVPAHTPYRCAKCSAGYSLADPTVAKRDDDDGVMYLTIGACAKCGSTNLIVSKEDAPQLFTKRGRPSSARSERIHTTMRYDSDVYETVKRWSNETGKSDSDVVNNVLRALAEQHPEFVAGILAGMRSPRGDSLLKWNLEWHVKSD